MVRSVTEDARSCSGTWRTVTPRSAWARNGKTIEEKSSLTHTTSASSGSEAATSPAKTDVWDPTATHSAGTPTSPAYSPRAVCTETS